MGYKERYKTREEKIIFVVPKQYYRFSWTQRASSKVRLGVIWPWILPPDSLFQAFSLWLTERLEEANRLTKINDKAENYAISTQQQLELELPFLLGSNGESELKGLKFVIWINWTIVCVFNCSDLLYLEVAASRHMVILSLSPIKNRLGSGIL